MNLTQNNFQLISLETETINAPSTHNADAKQRNEKTVLILLEGYDDLIKTKRPNPKSVKKLIKSRNSVIAIFNF